MCYDMMSCFGVERLCFIGVAKLGCYSQRMVISKSQKWKQGFRSICSIATSY
jgi:hypothetical protein